MTPPFRQLLNRFAMLAFERQMLLLELLGDEHDWELSLREGTVRFGERTWKLHLLGTRADDGTWLWAWAQKGAPVPASALASAKKVKQVGRKRQIPELIEEEFPLEPVDLDAHTVSMVASSIAELPAYYRFPYKGGALFAALEAPEVKLGPPDIERLRTVIRDVVARIEVDPRTAVETYLQDRGAKLAREKTEVTASWPDGKSLTVYFDDRGNLVTPAHGAEAGASA